MLQHAPHMLQIELQKKMFAEARAASLTSADTAAQMAAAYKLQLAGQQAAGSAVAHLQPQMAPVPKEEETGSEDQ